MKKLIFIFSIFFFMSCNTTREKRNETQGNILFIVSNQHTYGDTKINSANHFAEIVLAYDVLVKEGYQVDFVSPKGGLFQ